jgi:tetratricopeptide (TPR) repeat protein
VRSGSFELAGPLEIVPKKRARLLGGEVLPHYLLGQMPDRKVTKVYSHTLAGALTLSALAGGAIHLPFVVAYATLVVLSGCLALAVGRSSGGQIGPDGFHRESAGLARARLDVGAGIWGVLALVCLLQALPVPLGWLERVAPLQADVWARALRPFGAPPPEHVPLSLAPWRTLVEALKLASYGVIFQLSARLGRQGMGRIAALAFASALGVASVTLAHRAFGATSLFGVYTPSDTLAVAPILNPNSRAGYENLGFFCGLGLLFRAGVGPRAAFIGVGLLLLVIDILLCQSRGGTACLVFGMLLLPLLRGTKRPSSVSMPREALGRAGQVAIVAAIGVGATTMALLSRPKGGLGFDEPIEKLEVFRRAALLVLDHPLLGVGRGAFGSAFSTYQPRAGSIVFEHVENLPLQWAADFGVPIAALALAALGWAVWPIFSRRTLESPVRRAALVGVLMLLLQNLVDLGLEITAVAALWVYVLGGLLGAAKSGSRSGEPEREPRRRLLVGSLALVVVCLGLVLLLGSDSPARERDRLHERLAQPGAPSSGDWAALRAASLAYPADPYIPLVGAAAALAAHQDALPWAARALERAPESAPAHLVLGRALHARRASEQAVVALRRAIELDPDAAGPAIGLASGWNLPTELLARAVPRGSAGVRPLEILADLSPPGEQRLHWLSQALERDPERSPLHYRIALELYHDVLRGERRVICRERPDDCVGRAREHVARASASPTPGQAVLDAQLVDLASGAVAAEERLVQGCASFVGDEACASALVRFALRNRSPRLPEALRASIAAGCATRERCAATHLGLGRELAGAGQWQAAQNQFRESTQQWPTPEGWRALAAASTKLGQPERAEDALRRAALLDGEKKGAQ